MNWVDAWLAESERPAGGGGVAGFDLPQGDDQAEALEIARLRGPYWPGRWRDNESILRLVRLTCECSRELGVCGLMRRGWALDRMSHRLWMTRGGITVRLIRDHQNPVPMVDCHTDWRITESGNWEPGPLGWVATDNEWPRPRWQGPWHATPEAAAAEAEAHLARVLAEAV